MRRATLEAAAAALQARPPVAEPAAHPATARGAEADVPAAPDTVYVANAGIVLAGPYVPMLFERLGLVRDGAFVDPAATERGVHLLQFMVDGGDPAGEHQLPLNKLLCGMDLAAPIGREFRIEPHEAALIDGLLRALIARWTILGATSVAGLRESFFQRQGALHHADEAWRLRVEPRSFDMLIDQIPWGFATLRFAWMPQVLHVDWR